MSHAVDIEGLRRQQSHTQSPQTHSIAGSPQVEVVELPSDRGAGPIKQLSELDLELSKLIPKGGQNQPNGSGGVQQAVSQQQGQVKLYSEVVRQQSITVMSNEPQHVSIITTGDEVSSTKGNEEPQGINSLQAPPPLVRKVSRFQVSTVVEQQQMQQQQQTIEPERAVLITPNAPLSTTATVQQVSDLNLVYQQPPVKGGIRICLKVSQFFK